MKVSIRQNGIGTGFIRTDAILLNGHGDAPSAVTNGGNYASTWLFYKKSRAMINANGAEMS
jgi:hypothetical protein